MGQEVNTALTITRTFMEKLDAKYQDSMILAIESFLRVLAIKNDSTIMEASHLAKDWADCALWAIERREKKGQATKFQVWHSAQGVIALRWLSDELRMYALTQAKTDPDITPKRILVDAKTGSWKVP